MSTPNALPASEYRTRRSRLMGMMENNAIAIVPGARLRVRNRDVHYPFRQDSDFTYLTGFDEEDALLVLAPGRKHGEVILFCRERNALAERYDGERAGPERAAQLVGVDDAFPITDLADILPGMLEGRERIYFTLGEYPDLDRQIIGWVSGIRARESGGAIPPGEFISLKHHLHELRLFKTARELKLMRRAAEITVAGHERAMRACRAGLSEGYLEAELLHEFMRHGARYPAYPSIVGSGNNTCVLHYIRNDAQLVAGDLVLIDAGCEYQNYASDVTRTFPVNGRFSEAQREIYDLVLEAQLAAIDACQPGASFNAPHEVALTRMIAGLIRLGIMKGSVKKHLKDETYKRFCPHKTSHWLGLDVHDVGDYRLGDAWRDLEPGMVLTIEPGIYISDDETNADVDARWRGIGVRIEDDVLITRDGCEVLSAGLLKTAEDVEALMAAGRLSALA